MMSVRRGKKHIQARKNKVAQRAYRSPPSPLSNVFFLHERRSDGKWIFFLESELHEPGKDQAVAEERGGGGARVVQAVACSGGSVAAAPSGRRCWED
jgi:hypothetical protein